MPVLLAVGLIIAKGLMDLAAATSTPGPPGATGATGAVGPQGRLLFMAFFTSLNINL